jgi:hypothetical protein
MPRSERDKSTIPSVILAAHIALGPSPEDLSGFTSRDTHVPLVPRCRRQRRAVVSELDLSPPEPAEGRWELIRWWCREIVEGRLRPEVGGRMIWWEGWNELGYPDSLQPLVGWVSEWKDWRADWGVEREEYERKIVAEARVLLARPWPPN